jgi:pimeloyl-ACP methyl ester carboxylesterase
LVLAATTPGMLMVPGDLSALRKMANVRRYSDAKYMNEHFATLYGGLVRDPGAKAQHIGRLKAPSPRGYVYQLLAMLCWTSLPALPFLAKETLVMMGEDDRIVPVINGRILASLIPNARLEVLPRAGHLFLLTHPEESIALLRAFLDAPDGARDLRRAA